MINAPSEDNEDDNASSQKSMDPEKKINLQRMLGIKQSTLLCQSKGENTNDDDKDVNIR